MKSLKFSAAALLCATALPSWAFAQTAIVEAQGSLVYGAVDGRIGLTVPFRLDNGGYAFIDLSGGASEDVNGFGSFGAGYRARTAGGLVLGAYGYYDVLQTKRGNTFHQLSFGAEAIGDVFEARINAYAPVTSAKVEEAFNHAFISEGSLLFQGGQEQARGGADAEVGVRVPVFPKDAKSQLKLFGGGYWLDGKNLDDTFGVKARAELTVASLPGLGEGSTLGLGASVSYDREEKSEFGLRARLRIPLGGRARSENPFDPLVQPVERAGMIRTHVGSTGDVEAAEYVESGRTVGKVVQIAAGDTAATANAALAGAGVDALALANGEIALAQTLTLGPNQLLLGGGGAVMVRGVQSRLEAAFINEGDTATLRGTNVDADVLAIGSGSEVAALAIVGGDAGIYSKDTTDIRVREVAVSQSASDGVRLENVAGAEITDSSIRDLFMCESSTQCQFSINNPNVAPYAAISALGTSGLTVRNTAIDSVTYGIFAGSRIDESDWPPVLANEASGITIEDVAITRSRREGILLVAANDVTMNRVRIDNSALERSMDLVVLQGTSDVQAKDITLIGGINGLMLVASTTLPTTTTNVRFDRLSISDASNSGIFLNPVSDVHFSNVSIANPGTYGAFIYGSDWEFLGGPVKNASFTNMRISNAGEAGLHFLGPTVNLRGDVAVTGAPRDCLVSAFGSFINGSLTQEDGSVLTVNGQPLDEGNFLGRCN